MKIKLYIFPGLFLLLSLLFACGKSDPNQQVDEGVVKGETYHSKEIGWTMDIPPGFTIVSKDERLKREARGKEAVEESMGQEVDTKDLQHLISFSKDKFNNFSSTSQPFVESTPGEYDQTNRQLCEVIYTTFQDQGINVDTTMSFEDIQGMKFYKFETVLYSPQGEEIIRQILFSRLMNGFDFSVNINYNNEKDKETMLKAFRESKFEKAK